MLDTRAPAHLSARSKQLWADVLTDYALDAVDVERLRLVCEALDRCDEARLTIAVEGAIVEDRFHQKRPHPAVAIERDARIAALRGLRELGISEVQP